jgi:hypothetical protein
MKTKVFYERKRNVMLEFVISTILSGIIWDVIKGSQKLLYHYSLKKMNIAEAELTNLIENIPQEEKNNKKLVIEYLKEDSEYQILLKQAVRNVRSANLKKRMTVIVLVVIIVLGAGHYYLGVGNLHEFDVERRRHFDGCKRREPFAAFPGFGGLLRPAERCGGQHHGRQNHFLHNKILF